MRSLKQALCYTRRSHLSFCKSGSSTTPIEKITNNVPRRHLQMEPSKYENEFILSVYNRPRPPSGFCKGKQWLIHNDSYTWRLADRGSHLPPPPPTHNFRSWLCSGITWPPCEVWIFRDMCVRALGQVSTII